MKETQLSIIPRPVSIRYGEGSFESQGITSLCGDGVFSKEIEVFSSQLVQDAKKMGLSGFSEKPVNIEKVMVPAGEFEPAESYRLCILPKGITLTAASGAGVYRGLQVTRQLFLSGYRDGTITLPCAEISDYPRFPWRGFMLDCSRHFYTIPFIKRLLDVLSLHHINRFHWHLTDDQGWRLPIPEYPLLTEIGSRRLDSRMPWRSYIGGFYSDEEIRDLVDYATLRHIEIIPEVDLPGHTSAVLASYPGLGCTGGPYKVEDGFGIMEDVLCAGNDLMFDLFTKIFDTLARLFPSSYVHIGGDEVPRVRWESCPKCQRKLTELGLKNAGELQSYITARLVQMLAERGKTAIGWDEVLEDSPSFKLPKETVVMSWRGTEGGINASGLGHRVIMSPSTCGCYLDYKYSDEPEEPGQLYNGPASVYKSYSMDPVTPEMTDKNASMIIGGQCNLWSEFIYADRISEYMIFPRLCAIAEALWTPRENKDFDDFSRRLLVHRKRLDDLGLIQYHGPLQ
ncbi:MAG: beta-N-acetylhexosaminidase [Treponema sp.]|jgi:hexosaminidase|nr:beta-N-acetylhexosaminidase [Treponema sp.]